MPLGIRIAAFDMYKLYVTLPHGLDQQLPKPTVLFSSKSGMQPSFLVKLYDHPNISTYRDGIGISSLDSLAKVYLQGFSQNRTGHLREQMEKIVRLANTYSESELESLWPLNSRQPQAKRGKWKLGNI